MTKRILLGLILVAAWGCSRAEEPQRYRTFEAGVDSVRVPATVAPQDSLRVQVWAIIGPNLCYSFQAFETEAEDGSIRVHVMGRQDTGAGICPTALAEIQGKELLIPPPHQGDAIELVFETAGGEELIRTVEIQ